MDAILAGLSLADKAAQVVMPWIAGGYQAADDPAALQTQRWVDSLHVGGLIISVGPPTEAAVRLNALQRRSRLPLLIGSDLESGTSIRLQGGTPFPPQMGLGAAGDTLLAEAVGRITGREGRAVGMHFAFAPVADINNNPSNPVINVRAFGEDPAQVSALTRSLVRGIRAEGMLATVKHFPGHGDTGTDSHIALPLVTADPARLDSVELRPFREAIAAGVDAVMSAHIAFPTVTGDSALPGTLSAAVLTGLLRERLGFRGLVITDALDMGAIVSTYGAAEAAVRAFEAGADILLQPKDPEAAVAGLVAAVRSGRIGEARLDRSVRAVLAAKARLGLFAQREVPLDSVSAVVGNRAYLATARDAAARALVLADDAAGAVARLRRGPGRVAIVTYDMEPRPAAAAGIATALRARGDTVTLVRLHAASGPASLDSARAAIRSATTLVAAVGVRAVSGRGSIAMAEPVARLLDESAAVVPTVLVSLGSPYLLAQTPSIGSYLLAWSTTPLAEQAVGRALVGSASITGRLPVRIPPRFARGDGLTMPAGIPSGSLGN